MIDVGKSNGFQLVSVVWTCPSGMSMCCAAPGSNAGSSGWSAFGTSEIQWMLIGRTVTGLDVR
jgi:hypothetical protein